MSLIDLFKEFHSRAIVDAYPLSARALFDTLLFDFNAAFWPEERVYSQRELSRLTGLPTTTVHRAMKFLSERGYIKTHSTKRGTVVKLVEHRRNTSGTPAEHPRNTSGTPAASSNIRVREDVKTSDLKTSLLSDNNAHARAPVNRNSEVPTRTDLDAAQDFWSEEIQGGRLTIEHLSRLQVLIDRHGLDWVKAAMIETSDANGSHYGSSPKLLFAVIDRKLNHKPKPLTKPKGGEKREYDSASILGYTDDDAPDVSWIYEAQNAVRAGNVVH